MTRYLQLMVLLISSWCVMTVVHELGHVVSGLACGGALKSWDLLPWHLPYSIFDPDPNPIVTLWGGPILGALAPFALALAIRRNFIWFIAYFSMLANGVYIAAAWFVGDRYLDTPMLLEHGARPIWIAIYCVLTVGFGYIGFRQQCVNLLSHTTALTPDRLHTLQVTDEKESSKYK